MGRASAGMWMRLPGDSCRIISNDGHLGPGCRSGKSFGDVLPRSPEPEKNRNRFHEGWVPCCLGMPTIRPCPRPTLSRGVGGGHDKPHDQPRLKTFDLSGRCSQGRPSNGQTSSPDSRIRARSARGKTLQASGTVPVTSLRQCFWAALQWTGISRSTSVVDPSDPPGRNKCPNSPFEIFRKRNSFLTMKLSDYTKVSSKRFIIHPKGRIWAGEEPQSPLTTQLESVVSSQFLLTIRKPGLRLEQILL